MSRTVLAIGYKSSLAMFQVHEVEWVYDKYCHKTPVGVHIVIVVLP